MWLMNYITKNSIASPSAVKGEVKNSGSESVSVTASGEHKGLRSCLPYGVASVPPTGECAVVLPLDDGEVSLGVIADMGELERGELMLYSKGGACVVLKNDGRVLISGRVFINGREILND